MSIDLAGAWEAIVRGPVFGVALTLAAYQVGRWAWQRSGNRPWVNPVLVAVVLIGGFLALVDVEYDEYLRGGSLVGLLLGPATVALAWPMHKELALVRRAAVPILVGVTVGAGVAVVAAVVTATLAGGSEEIALSLAPKSATTPVSIALAETIGGLPPLTAVLTILTGIVGAVLGPPLLTAMRVRDARVRGLAIGVSSHGVGTAQMLHEGRTAGAFSGLAMALTALATSVWVPLLVPLLT